MVPSNSIKEGIVIDVKRFAIHDGPGVRTTVFLKGCPLSCWWCHNPESIDPNIESYTSVKYFDNQEFCTTKRVGYKITVPDIMSEIQKEQIFMEYGKGGVTLSGGEPLWQPEFAKSILEQCKLSNLHTALDTSGAISFSIIESVMPFVDLFLYDIKAMHPGTHKKYTGSSNDLILENFAKVAKANKPIIARVPLIHGVNTSKEELNKLLKLFRRHQSANFNEVHFLPYHSIGQAKYKRFEKENRMIAVKELTSIDMIELAKPFKEAGFNVKLHT